MDGIIRVETGPETIRLFGINPPLGRGFVYQAEVRSFLALNRTRLTIILADEGTAPLLPLFTPFTSGLGYNRIIVNICLSFVVTKECQNGNDNVRWRKGDRAVRRWGWG